MSLTIYLDVHVPSAVALGLRARGIDVLTSQDDGTRRCSDEDILFRSIALGRVLLTQDEDFLVIGARWQREGREFPGLLFGRQGLEVGRLIVDLEIFLKCSTADEMCNRIIHLPLR